MGLIEELRAIEEKVEKYERHAEQRLEAEKEVWNERFKTLQDGGIFMAKTIGQDFAGVTARIARMEEVLGLTPLEVENPGVATYAGEAPASSQDVQFQNELLGALHVLGDTHQKELQANRVMMTEIRSLLERVELLFGPGQAAAEIRKTAKAELASEIRRVAVQTMFGPQEKAVSAKPPRKPRPSEIRAKAAAGETAKRRRWGR